MNYIYVKLFERIFLAKPRVLMPLARIFLWIQIYSNL